jgi:hypothetical protein
MSSSWNEGEREKNGTSGEGRKKNISRCQDKFCRRRTNKENGVRTGDQRRKEGASHLGKVRNGVGNSAKTFSNINMCGRRNCHDFITTTY